MDKRREVLRHRVHHRRLRAPGRARAGVTHPRTLADLVPDEAATLRIVVKDDRVVGLNALGRRWNTEVWLGWIRERRPLPWVLEKLATSRFDEEFTASFPVLPSATIQEGA
jgi:hypothetical protein